MSIQELITKRLAAERMLVTSACILVSCVAIAWVLYALFGHHLIYAIYNAKSNGILSQLMPGRAATPLENYYEAADRSMRHGMLWFVILCSASIVLIRTRLLGKAALILSSLFVFSFFLFCFLEVFPALVASLGLLQKIDYYAYRAEYVSDPRLVFQQRPSHFSKITAFKGDKYSASYGVEVQPITFEWDKGEGGFTDSTSMKLADVVVIGDSYVAIGQNSTDRLGRRLSRLSGLTVANLGVGGYGPFQYLEILKRYGVNKHPRYALFCFFEGNDIADIHNYLEWQHGGDSQLSNGADYVGIGSSLSKSFLARYLLAAAGTKRYIRKTFQSIIQSSLGGNLQTGEQVHPDLAVVQLGEENQKILFAYKNDPRPTEEMLKSNEWRALGQILTEFKNVSISNHITPAVVYIPIAAHIYAEYSTEASGKNWLKIRAEQIASKANQEKAMTILSNEVDIKLISLSPAFEAAARRGELLYYPFDTHWNPEGREVAARLLTQFLSNDYQSRSAVVNLKRLL